VDALGDVSSDCRCCGKERVAVVFVQAVEMVCKQGHMIISDLTDLERNFINHNGRNDNDMITNTKTGADSGS